MDPPIFFFCFMFLVSTVFYSAFYYSIIIRDLCSSVPRCGRCSTRRGDPPSMDEGMLDTLDQMQSGEVGYLFVLATLTSFVSFSAGSPCV